MAKDKLTDYDATAASNTDVGGINIQGSAAISNGDNALREVMSHLAETNAGTYPVADTWTFGDPADLTKRARIDAGGVTAGQTRVLTAPDFNGTIATLAGTETLTNKTLTTPTLTLKQGTSPTPTAEGDIQWDTDDDAIVVGDGSSQKIFRANAWELIEKGTAASVATKDFTGLSAYRMLRLTFKARPATDGVLPWLRTSTNNGSSYDAGASDYNNQLINVANLTTTTSSATSAQISLASTNTVGFLSTEGASFTVNIFDWNQAAYAHVLSETFFFDTGGAVNRNINGAARAQETARDALRFMFSSGNISSMHYCLEGLRG